MAKRFLGFLGQATCGNPACGVALSQDGAVIANWTRGRSVGTEMVSFDPTLDRVALDRDGWVIDPRPARDATKENPKRGIMEFLCAKCGAHLDGEVRHYGPRRRARWPEPSVGPAADCPPDTPGRIDVSLTLPVEMFGHLRGAAGIPRPATPSPAEGTIGVDSFVEKVGGDYAFRGIVRALLAKESGEVRVVVENENRLLYIHNPASLRVVPRPASFVFCPLPGKPGWTLTAENIPAPSLPTRAENPEGLHRRYRVTREDGSPPDPRAVYFVLRIDPHGSDVGHTAACRAAAFWYAQHVERFGPEALRTTAKELKAKVAEFEAEALRLANEKTGGV